ncbi:MAG: dUTP diphosphatase [Bacillus sp. (in: firmicutes)]
MKIKFKKISPSAVVPTKAHKSDAGFDLTCTRYEVTDGELFTYHTDIAVEIPEGHVGLLFPRSSIYKQDLFLTNAVGVCDSCYRGEIMFKFKSTEYECNHFYEVGDRIGQLVIMPYPEVEFVEADELSDSDRGTGGYGSSGR